MVGNMEAQACLSRDGQTLLTSWQSQRQSHSPRRRGSVDSKSHISCHQAMSKCMAQVTHQLPGYQAQGPTYSRLGPGLFLDAWGLTWAWLLRLLEKQGPLPKAINHPVESPSRQSPMEGGLAGVWRLGWWWGKGGVQGPSPGCWPQPFAHMLPRGPLSLSLDSALPRPWPGKDRQNQGGLLRILEACLEPMKQSIHLGTAPPSNMFLNGFYPSEDGKCLQ